MIPIVIQREHVLKAAEWIDLHGVGARDSKKYLVVIKGRLYPPKLVISRAYFYAHGTEWSHENFTGGQEANSFLRSLGFQIVERGSSNAVPFGDRETRPGGERAFPRGPPDNMYA